MCFTCRSLPKSNQQIDGQPSFDTLVFYKLLATVTKIYQFKQLIVYIVATLLIEHHLIPTAFQTIRCVFVSKKRNSSYCFISLSANIIIE